VTRHRNTDTGTQSDSADERRRVRSDGGTPGTRRGDDARRDGGARTDGGAVDARPSGYGTTVIAQTIVRVVVPILALLFQGHNRPGGGFIGAVLTATAAVLVYVTFGREFLQTTLFGSESASGGEHPATEWYRSLFGVGLAVAVAGGVAPMFLGGAFLTQGVWFPHGLPLYGELEVATALVFDLGVYATVVGGLLTVVSEVGGE